MGFFSKLFQGPANHGAAPKQRLLVVDEHAHGGHLYPVYFRRNNLALLVYRGKYAAAKSSGPVPSALR